MKLSFAAFTATALVVVLPSSTVAFQSTTIKRNGALFAATIEEKSLEREAPGAGWVPDWEGRQGLSPEEFMQSDMSKPDLSEMWECPLTRWDSDKYVFFFAATSLFGGLALF